MSDQTAKPFGYTYDNDEFRIDAGGVQVRILRNNTGDVAKIVERICNLPLVEERDEKYGDFVSSLPSCASDLGLNFEPDEDYD